VNSVDRLLSFGAMSFGTAAGGLLIDLYGPRAVMGMIAVWIVAIAAGAALSGIRRLRDLGVGCWGRESRPPKPDT
jgi:hypothetical protein